MPQTPTKTTVEVFYWLPHCSTCQKAAAFLEAAGVKIERFVDVKTEAVERATVADLAKRLGSVEALFSKRALKYRAWGLHEKTLSDDDMLDYMVQEYTFIKRPVLVTHTGTVLAGFSKKAYEALLK